jgi:hypothetical protein
VNYIRFLRTVRTVEREASRRGYATDSLIDDPMLPDTGTLGQLLEMAAIGVDARLGPLSTRDRQLVKRLIRNCVLTSPPRQMRSMVDNNGKMAREWRRR